MDSLNKSNQNSSSKAVKAGLLVAFTASLCCITPVLALISGVGGVAASFSWMEPFRPYMIALTLGVLGFAWYQKLKPIKAEEIDCDCEDDGKEPFMQSKMFLGVVTIVGLALLAFPSYSHIFYSDSSRKITTSIKMSNIQQINFDIKGMTCTGCEEHIKHAALELPGVLKAVSSYESGTASIVYDNSQTTQEEVIKAVDATGYTITKSELASVTLNLSEAASMKPLIELELNVKGMTCTGCEEGIKYALNKVDGVVEADASYDEGVATVKFNDAITNKEAIIQAINSTGYTVTNPGIAASITDKRKQEATN